MKRLAGYAAAAWAAVFAAFHMAWAAGWYIGLDPDMARRAFAKPAFRVYDVVVAGLLVIAVPVALAMVQPWGRRWPRQLIGFLARAGSALLVLRSVAGVIEAIHLLIIGRFELRKMGISEPLFYLGAILFSVVTWRYSRSTEPRQEQAGP